MKEFGGRPKRSLVHVTKTDWVKSRATGFGRINRINLDSIANSDEFSDILA